jgi:Holliday junction resolvase RusA-like endonuclease
MAEELFIAFRVDGVAQPSGSKQSYVPIHKQFGLPFWKGADACRSCHGKSSVEKCRSCKPRIVVSTVDDNSKSKPWKAYVHKCAALAMKAKSLQVIDEKADGLKHLTPLRLIARFYKKRPDSHFRVGKFSGLLRDDAPQRPTGKPDSLKLGRAIEDAMTGAIYKDDSQIVSHGLSKQFGNEDKVEIEIWLIR